MSCYAPVVIVSSGSSDVENLSFHGEVQYLPTLSSRRSKLGVRGSGGGEWGEGHPLNEC